MIYDYIIIGGGISGLRIGNLIQNKYRNKNILIIEKNSRLGGRILSYKYKKYVFEEGAGRFNNKQKLILKLIKELGLNNKIKEIPNTVKYFREDNFNFSESLKKIFAFMKKNFTKVELQNQTISEIAKKYFDPINYKKFILNYPYYSEFFVMNSYDAIRALYIKNNEVMQYYKLEDGLSQIIKRLTKNFKNKGGKIFLKSNFLSYTKKNGNYITTFDKDSIMKNIECKNLIFALPINALLKIKQLKKVESLKFIKAEPLCRVYAIYNSLKWYKYNSKITTNNLLRYIIPTGGNSIMISYRDGPKARLFNKYNNEGTLKNRINKNVDKTFKVKNLKPNYLKVCYWDDGCSYWIKGSKSEKMSKDAIKPFKNENIFICGESISTYQAWIEGALETVDYLIKIV